MSETKQAWTYTGRLAFLFAWPFLLFALIVWVTPDEKAEAKHLVVPWTAGITYHKDERTKACYATWSHPTYNDPHWGPYFTYVPCELLDKADWQYYQRLALGGVEK